MKEIFSKMRFPIERGGNIYHWKEANTIFELKKNEKFEINNVKPKTNLKTDKKGIPFLSFVFLGVKPKDFSITSLCKSAPQKESTDGDYLNYLLLILFTLLELFY
jgi:hypothetical protein